MTEVDNNDSNDKLKETKPVANLKPKKSAKVVAKPKKVPIKKTKSDAKINESPVEVTETVDLDETIILDLSNINKPKLTTPKKKAIPKSKIIDILKDIPLELGAAIVEVTTPIEELLTNEPVSLIVKPNKAKKKPVVKKNVTPLSKKVPVAIPQEEDKKVVVADTEQEKLVFIPVEENKVVDTATDSEIHILSTIEDKQVVVAPIKKEKVLTTPAGKKKKVTPPAKKAKPAIAPIEKVTEENPVVEVTPPIDDTKPAPETPVKHQRSEVVQKALDSIGQKNDPAKQKPIDVEIEKEIAPVVVAEVVEKIETEKPTNKKKPTKQAKKKANQPNKKLDEVASELVLDKPLLEEEEINYNLKTQDELKIESDKAKIAKVLEQIVLKKDNISKMANESEAIIDAEVIVASSIDGSIAPADSSAKKAKSKKRKKKTNAQKILAAQNLQGVVEQLDEIKTELQTDSVNKVISTIKGKNQYPNTRNKPQQPEKITNQDDKNEVPSKDSPKVHPVAVIKEPKKPITPKSSETTSSKFVPNNMKVNKTSVPENKPVHKAKPVLKKNILEPKTPVIVKKDETDLFEKQQITERVTEIIANISFPQLPPEMQITTDQKLDLSIQKTLAQVEKFLKNEIYVDNTATILVGVSGGVDSVSLLDSLALLSEKFYFKIIIAHYNHSLRGADSDADEDFVKDLAIKYGFDYFSAKGDVVSYAEKNSISIELAARQLRYNFFERTSRNHYADFVATAHTADDSAETFLFNLFRGSGLTGLSGIPATRNFVKNVVIARPLLTLKKKEIIEYAKARKLKWREDRTNEAVDYTRNRIRRVLIPLLEKEFNPQIIEAINRAAELIYGADQNINQQVQSAAQTVITDIRLERFSMKAQTLQTFDEFMQGEILQYALNKHLKIPSIPMLTIDSILNLIGRSSGKMIEFQQSYQAAYDRNLLIIGKLDKKVDESAEVMKDQSVTIDRYKIKLTSVNMNEVKYNPNPKIEFLDAEQLPAKMIFRPWMQGDNFTPLGMNGTMKISDFLINEKIPSVDKPNIIVLANDDEVIWVCGYRINENYKISEKTKKAVKAEYYTL
ncbi:MAG: tRNA lysidine(34) synthetase TilS [bacterium]